MAEALSEEMEKVKKVMNEKLDENLCELELSRELNSALCTKLGESNEARKELIKALGDISGGGSCKIGVKRMGKLDENPFMKACKERYSGEEAEVQCAKLFSEWEENLKNASWHPFKYVWIGDKLKGVVDEEDEKLKNLRDEWGEAVKTAHEELNDHNASGRYSVPVPWNYEQGREATLKEGIAHMAMQIKTLKRKRT